MIKNTTVNLSPASSHQKGMTIQVTQADVAIGGRSAQGQQRVQERVLLGGPRQKDEEQPPHLWGLETCDGPGGSMKIP